MASTVHSPLVATELYHLFGFPIAHSASPTLHNYLFSRLGLHDRTYKLTPTTYIGRQMRDVCRAEEFGGASVTMPLKVTVVSMLDRVTDEARAIGAVNTIVLERDEQDRKLLIGTNTDWLGVRKSLLQHLELASSTDPAVGHAVGHEISGVTGMVIGGGGAARAAVYALASLKCTPIYLVGRDASELESLVTQFPQFPCVPISDPANALNVKVAVGCIPAVSPITPEEIAADLCTRAIFSSPSSAVSSGGKKRVFLEMCYKPCNTSLMLHAASAGWTVVSGIEAMLEQGFAQARMWLAKSVDPQDGVGLIPPEIEEGARTLIREMLYINLPSDEVVPIYDGEDGRDVEPS